ncbi:hypothetical protein [Mycolicibacterium mengxianglii]|uniref:hypothetical protein n=1 Tax=Mycolicibacterium mengxianglii TaxID=2736649 RepID=UPI0018EEEF06|nr:hypothetical protein [Mycolicibacterium mengxianglii]
MPDIDTIREGHTETARLGVHELVRRLNAHLGPTLVAVLANVRDRKLPSKWAQADGPVPRPDSQSRLQMAHRVWLLISGAENEHVARAWFIGANPRLGEISPVMKLQEGALPEVMSAARAFVEGADD